MKNLSAIDEAKDLITKEWLESGSNNLALQAKTLHVGGNASLEGETLADSIIAGSLLVNGDARFVNTIQGNVATATKLATARIFWGQSFDGSGNVTGDMSSVGSISMNGALSGATTGAFSSNVTVGGALGVTGALTTSSNVTAGGMLLVTTSSASSYVNFNEGIRINGFSNNLIHFGGTAGSTSGSGGNQWTIGMHGTSYFALTYNIWANTIISAKSNGNVGIGKNDPSYLLDVNGETRTKGLRVSNGSKEVALSVDTDGNLKFDGNIYATGFVSAGGVSSTEAGGGGLDWSELTSAGTQVIHASHIPNLSIAKIGDIASASVDNAAKLGGVAASLYATQTWVENKGYLTSHQDISGKADKSSTVIDRSDDSNKSGADCNELISLGVYRFSGTVVNGPDGAGYGTMFTARGAFSDTAFQIFGSYSRGRLYGRAGTWYTSSGTIRTTGWHKIAWVSDIPTSLPASDVSAWAKKSSLAASDVPSLDWSKITTGKPTTISGYGITDAITTSNIGSQNVSYATSAGHLQDKVWRGDNNNGDGMPFVGYKKLATLQCGVWMIVNTTFAVHSRHSGTLRYSLSLRLNDSYASYDCFVKAFGVVTESDQLRFFYNTSTGVFTIWKYFYDYDYTYVTTEYSTYLEFNGDNTQYSDIPAGQGTEIGVDINVANSINSNNIVLKNPYDPTNYRITLRSDWDSNAHTRFFGAHDYELLRGVQNDLSLMPDNNGNVGVGVTVPYTKLHVNGRIAVNGPEILNWSSANGGASTGELGWYGISKYDCADGSGGWGLRIANYFGMQYCVGGNYQHYFEGRITCSSEITAYSSSDARLKEDIRDFNALEALKSLGGYKAYRFNGLDGAEDTTTIRYGLIYQNVVKSEFGSLMAYERENGYGALNYVKSDYINLIGASVLEVEDEVMTLKKKVEYLEKIINDQNLSK